MPADDALVGPRIEEIRKAKKLSRQELGDKLGLTYLQVYRMETGETEISADDIPEIAAALGCSITSLYREAKAS